MAELSTTSPDESRHVVGYFTATGTSPGWPITVAKFNFSIWGTFAGTAVLERSFDGGAVWIPCSYGNGVANSFTTPMTLVCEEIETDVLYRVNCTTLSSGLLNWRLSL